MIPYKKYVTVKLNSPSAWELLKTELLKALPGALIIASLIAILTFFLNSINNSNSLSHALYIEDQKNTNETADEVFSLVAKRTIATIRRIDSEIMDFERRRLHWVAKYRESIDEWSIKYDITILDLVWDFDQNAWSFLSPSDIQRAVSHLKRIT